MYRYTSNEWINEKPAFYNSPNDHYSAYIFSHLSKNLFSAEIGIGASESSYLYKSSERRNDWVELAKFSTTCRGVQYVHWVMHKCIMVKVGGKRNTRKVCKKQVNLSKTGGKYLSKQGGNNNFCETGGGNVYWNRENRGEIPNLWSMTKKSHQKFRWMKENQEIFQEKVKLWKLPSESENFSKIGGKSETGEKMHHGLRGGWTPLTTWTDLFI